MNNIYEPYWYIIYIFLMDIYIHDIYIREYGYMRHYYIWLWWYNKWDKSLYKVSLHPGLQVAPDLPQSCHYFSSRFGESVLLTFFGEFRFSSWTAPPNHIFRVDRLSNLRYGSVRSFQRGSFRQYIVSELYLGIVFHKFCHFVK